MWMLSMSKEDKVFQTGETHSGCVDAMNSNACSDEHTHTSHGTITVLASTQTPQVDLPIAIAPGYTLPV
jgi:hypothetical protein